MPDPVLRTPCDEIKKSPRPCAAWLTTCWKPWTIRAEQGLSANQIGVSLRAFSYNIDGKVGYVLNPVLEEKSGEQYGDEGCLSVPGLWYKTRRADYARVRGIDLDGNEVVLEGSGLMGRMLQHECDHLDGHVYLDRLEKEERREALRYMRNRQASSPYSAPTGWSRRTVRLRVVLPVPPVTPLSHLRRQLPSEGEPVLVPAPCYSRNLCATRQRTQSLASRATQYCQPAHNKFASCSRRLVSVGCATRETGEQLHAGAHGQARTDNER